MEVYLSDKRNTAVTGVTGCGFRSARSRAGCGLCGPL